jgi:hypothetical protein
MSEIPSIQSINRLGFITGGFSSARISSIAPDPGFVFVFTADDEQVFDQDDNAVQVLDIYANS